MKTLRRYGSIFLGFLTLFTMPVYGQDKKINQIINETGNYILDTVKEPEVGSIGGEWAIIGLGRSEVEVPKNYYEDYYKRVEKYVKEKDGVLHSVKYTEYSRLIMALTAIGKNPEDVAGYNLIEPLANFEKTIWQGINGPIFALIALDSGNYEIPENKEVKIQGTRQMYIDEILLKQLDDGGFALSGDKSDADITAMALQALSKYKDDEKVEKVINEALDVLSNMQDDNGGFTSWGISNSESSSQVLNALMELGISIDDPRFVKNKKTVMDNLLSFYVKDKGFLHSIDGSGENLMSTEQAFYSLVNYQRVNSGKSSLYNMADKDKKDTVVETEKNNDSKNIFKIPEIKNRKTFRDIEGYPYKDSIEELASRGIVNGINENEYMPESPISRAEFSTIVVKGLGLSKEGEISFTDVVKNAWYYPYISTAYGYNIVSGKSAISFEPETFITREEAAVLLSRVALLGNIEIELDEVEIRDILAQFPDYVKIAPWAKNACAFAYKNNIMSVEDINIRPQEYATRGEIAEMFNRLLDLVE